MVKEDGGRTYQEYMALCKGAPEVLESLMVDLPADYSTLYKSYVKEGYRVIALASKILKVSGDHELKQLKRSDVESQLSFAGFLIFECPLKSDSASVIKELKESGHETKMITGDNILTAAHVAQKLKMADRNKKACNLGFTDSKLQVFDFDEKLLDEMPLDQIELTALSKKSVVCLKGTVLSTLQDHMSPAALALLLRHVHVFARTSPTQKDFIVR